MKQLTFLLYSLLYCDVALAIETPPQWAYAQNPPNSIVQPNDNSIRHVPNSDLSYTFAQVKDLFFAPDWHPQDHAPLPDVVAQGRKPDVYACGFCHRADGPGGPENASLAGLPKNYIVQQMADFKSGARKSSVPDRAPVTNMLIVAKAISDADIEAAAVYFSSLKPRKNIRVIETNQVPKTFERGWHLAKTDTGETEPIGKRIIEVPDVLDDFISRDSRTTFTAYVPKGSIKKGRKLVQNNNQNLSCTSCHGKELRGDNNIPALAGRSPSYITRQIYDFKLGLRKNSARQAMQLAVQNLNADDIIAIASYSASLDP
ncbi:cytochrome c-binding protein [Cellvibrio zantedeschiae]|uniref:Cytochrome c-binding protein n=1 Tax=Cellvibrio zantedeschiae TaxID=1237077 RepID=A0ABQ3B7K5_9GAMM|nr:c-type cytochrome [Cellvibrio zantedeschiae]GGY77582.1 cytochrome c-binding protein [Cellvibrio zantedeschiae]